MNNFKSYFFGLNDKNHTFPWLSSSWRAKRAPDGRWGTFWTEICIPIEIGEWTYARMWSPCGGLCRTSLLLGCWWRFGCTPLSAFCRRVMTCVGKDWYWGTELINNIITCFTKNNSVKLFVIILNSIRQSILFIEQSFNGWLVHFIKINLKSSIKPKSVTLNAYARPFWAIVAQGNPTCGRLPSYIKATRLYIDPHIISYIFFLWNLNQCLVNQRVPTPYSRKFQQDQSNHWPCGWPYSSQNRVLWKWSGKCGSKLNLTNERGNRESCLTI